MAIGIIIGKIRIGKISLGISGIMFAGILAGHLGYQLDVHVTEFLRDFGLILFVYAVGMQVGPSFFSSFKKDGLRYNALAISTVLGAGITTIVLFKLTGFGMDNLVGLMSGAVTNTPGLGAAKATLKEIGENSSTIFNDPANAYAISYPFGVLGLILVIVISKKIMGVNLEEEIKNFEIKIHEQYPRPHVVKCRITHPDLIGKTIKEFHASVMSESAVRRIINSLLQEGSSKEQIKGSIGDPEIKKDPDRLDAMVWAVTELALKGIARPELNLAYSDAKGLLSRN